MSGQGQTRRRPVGIVPHILRRKVRDSIWNMIDPQNPTVSMANKLATGRMPSILCVRNLFPSPLLDIYLVKNSGWAAVAIQDEFGHNVKDNVPGLAFPDLVFHPLVRIKDHPPMLTVRHPLVVLLTMTLLAPCVATAQEEGPAGIWRALQEIPRHTADDSQHPGNVFLLGQTLSIRLPEAARAAKAWSATDEKGNEIAHGTIADPAAGVITIERLPVGWYRITAFDDLRQQLWWTTSAVLSPPVVPTSQQSPICVDAAMAWFAKNDPHKQEEFSRLAALAGVNWVRDRMRWRDMQPCPGSMRQTPRTTARRGSNLVAD